MELEESAIRRLESLAEEFADLPLELVVRCVAVRTDQLLGRDLNDGDAVTTAVRDDLHLARQALAS